MVCFKAWYVSSTNCPICKKPIAEEAPRQVEENMSEQLAAVIEANIEANLEGNQQEERNVMELSQRLDLSFVSVEQNIRRVVLIEENLILTLSMAEMDNMSV